MIKTKSECPYCGFVNNVLVDFENITSKTQIVCCELDEGGCDKLYVAKITANVNSKSFKIEGEI